MKNKEIKGKPLKLVEFSLKQKKRHFIILNAPGHKCFLSNMIGGAVQVNIAVIVLHLSYFQIIL
jgi:translation elongation factor EF-1alpha